MLKSCLTGNYSNVSERQIGGNNCINFVILICPGMQLYFWPDSLLFFQTFQLLFVAAIDIPWRII